MALAFHISIKSICALSFIGADLLSCSAWLLFNELLICKDRKEVFQQDTRISFLIVIKSRSGVLIHMLAWLEFVII